MKGALLDQQRRFAHALLGKRSMAVGDVVPGAGLDAAARLGIHANNARMTFEAALRQTYPVFEQRVGRGYFGQLAHAYRHACATQSGDRHEIGRAFPDWLDRTLPVDEYRWLADLARLEWACADASTESMGEPTGIDALAGIAAEKLAETRLILCSSLRWVSSIWPVFSVWRANQPGGDRRPVSPARGGEGVLVRASEDAPLVLAVAPPVARLAGALAAGLTLVGALEDSEAVHESTTRPDGRVGQCSLLAYRSDMSRRCALPALLSGRSSRFLHSLSGLAAEELTGALALLFAQGFVCGVQPPQG